MNCNVSCAFCARVIAALAPESAAPRMQEGSPCATCAHPQGWHEPDPDTGEGPLECSPPDCSVCPCLDFATPRVEPRRPQVGDRFEHYEGDPLGFVTLVAVSAPTATCFDNDCRMRWDDGSEQDYHTSFLLGEYGSAWRPAPQATQGAAVAGPAPGRPMCGLLCPLIVGGHYVCTRPLPHAHTPEEVLASLRTLTPPPPAVAGPARECPLPCVLPPGHEGLHRLSPPLPAVAGPAQCGRCGHDKSRHGGMLGLAGGTSKQQNADRCGDCEQGGGYCERWTACYGTFPDGPPPPTAEEWLETVTPMLVANRRADELRIRAEAAAERTGEIVLGLYEDAASWRTMAAKMLRDKERLMCDRRASVLEGRARAIASRYGVDGEPPDAFPKG